MASKIVEGDYVFRGEAAPTQTVEEKRCPKCGAVDVPGVAICPVYHGYTGTGFCPIFSDGKTALETATLFHDLWQQELNDNRKLQAEMRHIKKRGLLSRIFNLG